MAISAAVQNGSSVRVYDEKGRYLFERPGEVQGYTNSTVSVRQGHRVVVYSDKGAYLREYQTS